MPAIGRSLAAITDIAAADSVVNVIEGLPGSKLARRSLVQIFLTREAVLVLAAVTVGGTNVYPSGPVNINTVVGSLPSTQDDLLIEVIGGGGDDIIISGTNTSAGSLELRALVRIMPI